MHPNASEEAFTIDFPAGKRGEIKGQLPGATEVAAGEVKVTPAQARALRNVISVMEETQRKIAPVNGTDYGISSLRQLLKAAESQAA